METFTEYKREPQQLDLQPSFNSSPTSPSQPKQIDASVVKAAFAFHNNADAARRKRDSQFTVTTTSVPPTPMPDSPEEQAIRAHEARHLFRIRLARSIQHLITSLLSLAIAIMQGQTYSVYQQTKDVHNAWPVHADVFPTLLLFSVAVVALVFDIAAIIAYVWPNTRIGQKAFKVRRPTQSLSFDMVVLTLQKLDRSRRT